MRRYLKVGDKIRIKGYTSYWNGTEGIVTAVDESEGERHIVTLKYTLLPNLDQEKTPPISHDWFDGSKNQELELLEPSDPLQNRIDYWNSL